VHSITAQPLDVLHVSIVTFAENRFGIDKLTDARRRVDLEAWLTNQLRPLFAHRVLDVSEDIVFTWRLLVESGRKSGHTFSQPDLFIAATALHHGLTVVTRDTGEFELAGVPVFNPWST
jgi:predicted nucleic acid-binding protein